MHMPTTARVSNLVNPGASLAADAREIPVWLHLINQVSITAERYMDRHAAILTRTEYYDVRPHQRVFPIRGYPVTSVASVKFDTDQGWGSDITSLVAGDDYFSPVYDDNGLLVMKHALNEGNERAARSLRVVYTGGMAADTMSFVESFPDIAGGIDQQVAFLWHRRNDLGAASVSSEVGTVSVPAVEDWLPTVRAIIDRYRRLPIAA